MLGVEIPTRGRPEWLLATLCQLYAQLADWDGLVVVASQPSDLDERCLAVLRRLGQSASKEVVLRVVGAEAALPEKHQAALETLKEADHIMILHDDLLLPEFFFADLETWLAADLELGAVAGVYPLAMYPAVELPADYLDNPVFNGRIEEAVNWHQVYLYPDGGLRNDVQHLFGPFMYKREALEKIGGFPVGQYSRVSHREETIVTYKLYQAGWKLGVAKRVIAPHFMYPKGGAADGRAQMMAQDEQVFRNEVNG